MGDPFLVGDRVYLRALLDSDADGPYVSWFNDEVVCRGNSHHVFPYRREAALVYIRQAAQTREDLILAIILHENEKHIGNVALLNIHPVYRTAEFAIVVGEKSVWGKGYGKEAAWLLCDHAFAVLNLNRVACGTFDDNTAMIRLALSLGMKEEGRRRAAAFKAGRYVDVIEFGLLQGEYQNRKVESM